MPDKDDLIKQATEGTGTPGRTTRELLYPHTDHDKIVATEALVEVMRQHQVQQGIVMQQMADTMMKMRDDIDKRLDGIERIFNEHCRQTDKDCGACRMELEAKIAAGEEKNTIKLDDVIDKVERILKRQEDKIDKAHERMTPKWVTTTFITIVMAVFMVCGGAIWTNAISIRDNLHNISAAQTRMEHHEEEVTNELNKIIMPNAQGFNGVDSNTYGIKDEGGEDN